MAPKRWVGTKSEDDETPIEELKAELEQINLKLDIVVSGLEKLTTLIEELKVDVYARSKE